MTSEFEYIETNLKGKTALITGASSGIGFATAHILAKQGVHLHLTGRRSEKLEEIAQTLRKENPHLQVQIFPGDVRDINYIKSLDKSSALEVDFFINNAGLARGVSKVADAELSDWTEMIDTNVTAAFVLTRYVLPRMIARGGGHMLFTGSIAGHYTYEGGSAYAATKHALHAFARVVREENCDKNIKVTTVAPGMVDTEFSLVRLRDSSKASEVYKGMKPLSATDIAMQMLFALKQPAHVNIDEIIVTPTVQGGIRKVHRV